jgi:UDP-N-acetylmuramyl-tripeptide synthetase
MATYTLHDLAQLLGGTLVLSASGNTLVSNITATSVALSHTEVTPGAVFVAVRGNSTDGHRYVDQAFNLGAIAAVVEDAAFLKERPGIVVQNCRAALSKLASLFSGQPSQEMKVIGITGTNGKTTTNWIIYHVLQAIGGGALRIGTLGWEYLGRTGEEGSLTSPDPISLHRIMQKAKEQGVRTCVMETSSHALHQARVEDVAFDVAVFTNLSRDHLDYHKTFENYFAAKCHLFELLHASPKSTRAAVINTDSEWGRKLLDEVRSLGLSDWSFGRAGAPEILVRRITEASKAMEIALHLQSSNRDVLISAPFIGTHNAENIIAAFGACCALGYDPKSVAEALASVPQVPGRLERIGNTPVRVFVDYAHTPDALERAITALKPSTAGKLWVIFGCGGDRDRGKRPQMGTIAAANADRVVVTSDNPRTEAPEAIISDILASGIKPHLIEPDRRVAILQTISAATPGDSILIAGKGHENYQIIGTKKLHFSDQEVAAEALG